MCFDDQAVPPPPPVPGAVAEHGELYLLSADGAEFSTYYAYPPGRVRSAVVIMPDVRGLHRFYRELAQRFAEVGVVALAIDYFGRTTEPGSARDGSFPHREHVDQMRPEQVTLDVAAAVRWLRENRDHDIVSVFTVGFCMGGSLSWAQSAADLGLAGCVGFYGIPSRVAHSVPTMKAPLLLLAAGQDTTPVDEVERFAEQVRAAGVDAELYVYPEAPHSFFDRTAGDYEQASADAWRRVVDFVGRHSD
ncbi:MAG: dienelactone hydrolase family protein [Jiangellaceae bacterium]